MKVIVSLDNYLDYLDLIRQIELLVYLGPFHVEHSDYYSTDCCQDLLCKIEFLVYIGPFHLKHSAIIIVTFMIILYLFYLKCIIIIIYIYYIYFVSIWISFVYDQTIRYVGYCILLYLSIFIWNNYKYQSCQVIIWCNTLPNIVISP